MQFDGFQAQPYQPDMAPAWDAVVDASHGGTVLHSRRFLDYHGDRFRDLSLVATRNDVMTMVLAMAADRTDPELAISHPGSSFGGVLAKSPDPLYRRNFLRVAAGWLHDQGFRKLLYRTTPRSPAAPAR